MKIQKPSALIADKAKEALIQEVATTPKPGLVDIISSGSHTDMDYPLFLTSAEALHPFFCQMAERGYTSEKCEPSEIFAQIRIIGLDAERAMFEATRGVNTHKGAIFVMGILVTAVGHCVKCAELRNAPLRLEAIFSYVKQMCFHTLQKDFISIEKKADAFLTHGERLYKEKGIRGVRGQVIDGFPLLKESFFLMKEGIAQGYPLNTVSLHVLVHLCLTLEDTTIIHRGGMSSLFEMRAFMREIAQKGGAYTGEGLLSLVDCDRLFMQKGISPGGAADLLSATLFLVSLPCCCTDFSCSKLKNT